MIAEITVTPTQVGIGFGVLVVLGGALLLFRKVFDYATTDELVKMETRINGELMLIKSGIKEEMAKQTVERHQMRHEVTRLEVAIAKVEVQMLALPDKIAARMVSK